MRGGSWRIGAVWSALVGLSLVCTFTAHVWAGDVWEPVYRTDFSFNPNWTTDDPTKLQWDSSTGTFHGTQVNTQGTYAYTNIAGFDPTKAWRLDFDTIINSDDWSAGLTFGLFGSSLLYPYGAIVDRGIGDGGHGISLNTSSSIQVKYSPSWSTGVWYHNELEYNPGSGQLAVNITNQATGSSFMNMSVPVSSFPSDMTNLGVSRLHIKGASSGLSPLATVDYNLDNVTLSMMEVKPTGRIAFQSNADDPNYEIYTIRPDGSGRLRITSDGGVASYEPAWSHDGTRLAWYGGTPGSADIFVANHDGTGLSILNGGGDDVSPDFSPDGSQMVFTMVGGEALHTMTYPSGSVTPLAEVGSYPDWSPDGRYITYTHWASGTAAEIWSLDLSLHTITRLTKRSLDGLCSWSEWSPDGSKIAYICAGDGTPDIWVMNPDGSGKTNITASWTASDETDPTWSPDGSYLAFVSDLEGSKDIWVMNADGSNSYRVTTSPGDEFAPDWGPEVPEPATLTLLGVGVVALTAALRRKTIC